MVHRLRRFIPALFIISITIASTVQLTGNSAHAAAMPSQAITLSPASTEIAVDAGTTISKTVDIINSGSDAFNAKLSSSPYYVSGEDYDPHFTQLPGTVDASEWVHISLTTATIGGLKVLSVPYTVQAPQGTPPGGYYAVIFVETSTNDTKTGVVSHNRVGNILYITVNGNIKSGGTVVGDPLPLISFVGAISIGTKVSNSGGTHFITDATYSVVDFTGTIVFSAKTERYILPQTERHIASSWTPQSLFGIYTIKRSATVDGVAKSLPDQKIVIINPWLIVAAAFLIGILIGVPAQRARQRRRAQAR